MIASLGRHSMRGISFGLFFLCLIYSTAGQAKTTGVDDDAAVQTGPCYQTLFDRNIAHPTTAPNREIGAACAAENGDVEKAWARIIRLWGSDSADVPDYDAYVRTDTLGAGGPGWIAAAVAGILLIYAVLGTPIRSAARVMSGEENATRRASETAASIVSRALLGLLLVWFAGFSVLVLIGAVIFLILTARCVGASAPPPAPFDSPREAQGLAEFAAETINDLGGAGPGLVGIALFARHDLRLLAAGVLLALVASIPSVIFARRALRSRPLAMTVLATLLVALVAEAAYADMPFASLVGDGLVARAAVGLAFALVVAAWGLRNSANAAVSPTSATVVDRAHLQ